MERDPMLIPAKTEGTGYMDLDTKPQACACTTMGVIAIAAALGHMLKVDAVTYACLGVLLAILISLVVILFGVSNRFQAWSLENGTPFISKLFMPAVVYVDNWWGLQSPWLDQMKKTHGQDYCTSGMLVLSKFSAIEEALTTPRARTWRLGITPLSEHRLPVLGGRNVFLLCLSDKGAGGNGDHEVFKSVIVRYCFNGKMHARLRDQTSKRLLDELAKDYMEMDHGYGGSFFSSKEKGLCNFLIRWLHYALLGLDPDDKEMIKFLTGIYYPMGAGYYLKLTSKAIQCTGVTMASIDKCATIYENSPVLKQFKEEGASMNDFTKSEFSHLLCAIIAIAGAQGPLTLLKGALGGSKMPAFKGEKTSDIDVVKIWDQLDLSNKTALEDFIYEVGRLWTPVSHVHYVAQEPVTAFVAGKQRTFPVGTKVLVVMALAMVDKGFWGPSAYGFDATRKNLREYSMMFNCVGQRSAGRMCPGAGMTMELCVDILKVLGEARRRSPVFGAQP